MTNIVLYPRIASEPISEYAYRVLYENIIRMDLKPGECLSTAEVAKLFQTSRTPIQSAFSRLTAIGLLDVYPQRGTYVSLIDMKRVYQSVYMRNLTDQAIIRILCEKELSEKDLIELEANLSQQEFYYSKDRPEEVFALDLAFHAMLYRLSNMDYVQQALQSIVIDQHRMRMLKLRSHIRWQQTSEEHRIILQAIRDKNAEIGCQQSYQHVSRFGIDIEATYALYPNYFTNWSTDYLKMFDCEKNPMFFMKTSI